MAHFAELDESGNVLRVIVVNNSDCGDLPFPESEPVGVAFCKMLFGEDTNWLQTSYNSNFRGQYAGRGCKYDSANDVFVPPQPFPSWTYNSATKQWEAPIAMPTVPDGYLAIWDEIAQEWDIILAGNV